ncbi:MAG: ABC transporter substrate-binding protein [Coriobacteriales bacterium]|nr:ABC transporter substrate-binding protein [Coriobacteriales bacterium]
MKIAASPTNGLSAAQGGSEAAGGLTAAAGAPTAATVRQNLSMMLLALLLAAGLALSGCSAQNQPAADAASAASASSATEVPSADPVAVKVLALKGPTAMGLVDFFSAVDAGEVTSNDFSYSIVAAPDEVTAAIAKGDADIAAVPANVAAVLYNNTQGGVKALTINTLGVLYLLEDGDSVTSVEQLRGKTIYASGKGATPEYALNYILEKNQLVPGTDVTIEWLPEHSAVVAALASNPNGVAMLPQPFVTTVQVQNANLRVALDLNQEWARIADGSALVTGATIVRSEFAKEHPEAVADFLARYQESVEFVNSDVDAAATLVGSYDIVTAEVAKAALPKCNIVFIAGPEMQAVLGGYLQVLYEQNPKTVGGTLPDDDFYYKQ